MRLDETPADRLAERYRLLAEQLCDEAGGKRPRSVAAARLRIPPTALTSILDDEQGVTPALAHRACEALGLEATFFTQPEPPGPYTDHLEVAGDSQAEAWLRAADDLAELLAAGSRDEDLRGHLEQLLATLQSVPAFDAYHRARTALQSGGPADWQAMRFALTLRELMDMAGRVGDNARARVASGLQRQGPDEPES